MRTVMVPDWGDSGSLFQPVQVPEPGDEGYPAKPLPLRDPCAAAWNQALADIEIDAALPAAAEPEAQ